MSYIINNSRGNVLVVIADGTINTSATSLGLVGRLTTDYGQTENENIVFLLENFAKVLRKRENYLSKQLTARQNTSGSRFRSQHTLRTPLFEYFKRSSFKSILVLYY